MATASALEPTWTGRVQEGDLTVLELWWCERSLIAAAVAVQAEGDADPFGPECQKEPRYGDLQGRSQ